MNGCDQRRRSGFNPVKQNRSPAKRDFTSFRLISPVRQDGFRRIPPSNKTEAPRSGFGFGRSRSGMSARRLFMRSIKSRRKRYEACGDDGAGDEIRTRYLHLGKVALCQMSYARGSCRSAAGGASGQSRTGDTRIFSPLLYQLSYRGIWRPGTGSNRRPPA